MTINPQRNLQTEGFENFSQFYPFYLSEHQNVTSRRLHFVGTAAVIILIMIAIITQKWALLWFLPLIGYGFAWAGHFFFEHNKPATFKHPVYSLRGDFVMFADILRGRVSLKE